MIEPDSLSAEPGKAPTHALGSSHTERGVTVRQLATPGDYAAAIELQRVTWGRSFREVVPEAILKISQRVGGVAAGAFDEAGEMLGFVYGMTGLYDGRVMHWSHMLAVRPDARDHGIGGRLKQYQRELVRARGVEWMYWTFDPLVARNAHRNFNGLGVSVREYVIDMYRDTGSDLHAFGTDRFIVALHVDSPSVLRSTPLPDALVRVPTLNDCSAADLAAALERGGPVRIAVPFDVEVISVEEARNWRAKTRAAFLAALEQGYQVSAFQRGEDRCFYILTKSNPATQSA
jgi:predicted GNAT superfamily acetyltransferase